MDTTGNGHNEDEFFLEMSDDSAESDGVQGDDGATDVCYIEEELPPGVPNLNPGECQEDGASAGASGMDTALSDDASREDLETTEVLDQQEEAEQKKASSDLANESFNQLTADYDALKVERDKFREQLVRKAADLDNYRKRVAREREEQKLYGHEKFALEMLPVLDSLERGISAIGDDGAETANSSVKDGMVMIYRQLLTALKRFGVDSFDAVGTMFDPQKHEAVQSVETDQYDSGVVVEEFQRGYFINGRLLRPAMVSVAKNVSG